MSTQRSDRERHVLVKSLFLKALEREPAARPGYLDRACTDDPSLRREVEELLASHAELGSGSSTAVLPTPGRRLTESAAVAAGERVGPYRIVGTLGQGGMGRVYLALRDDGDFWKRVALKIVRPSVATAEILRRFRQERQILAALDHPNIAKLLDGGSTPDGRPYFVMEYVEGEAIDSYCDSHRLSVPERLGLFRTVCAAVHFAHQNLVVHRDLKPSNILIDREGVPKLLDFGVAKLLNPELSSAAIAPTRFDVRVMTPRYASPEQVRDQPVTTATDVYALGVLLYELLTGHLPYPVEGRSLSEVARVICEREPTQPSAAVTQVDGGNGRGSTPETVSSARRTRPKRLRRQLSGDLDNIVLMALRKEARRRYSSVNQFSEDVRRHLSGEPVVARKDTLGYRTRKFVLRHRAGVVSAAAFVALLSAFAIAMAAQSARVGAERDRAQEARRQAEEQAETARQVSQFLIELFEVSDPDEARGSTITAREILERGARRIARDLADRPLVRARLMETIGKVYEKLGLFPDAESLLVAALDSLEDQLGADHLALASGLSTLGEIYRQQGRYAEAEPLQLRALAIREAALGGDDLEVAVSLNRLAILYGEQHQSDAAEGLLRRALAIRERALGPRDPDLALVVNNLAILYAHQGRLDEAAPLFERALEIGESALPADHPQVGMALNNLAEVYRLQGKLASAAPLFSRAVDVVERALGPEHPLLGDTLKGLADLHAEDGELAAAERVYRRVLAIREKVLGPRHQHTLTTLRDYAAVLRRMDRHAEAAALEGRAE